MAAYYRNKYRGRGNYRKYSSATTAQKKGATPRMDQTGFRWQKLLKYYGDCISVENAGEITLFAFREGVDFLQVPSSVEKEWVTSGKERLEFEDQNEHLQSFLKGPRWSRGSLPYFYGFPCHVKYIERSQRGWSGYIIQPILIFGIDLVQTKTGYAFVLQSDRPRINSAFLTDKGLLTSIEERKYIAETVLESWDEEKSREQNLRMILTAFTELLPQEIPFSKDILMGKIAELKTSEKKERGIYSTAVIFRGTDSPYTYGLEQEVSELRDTSALPNEIWRVILDRNIEIKEEENYEDLLEITALNDEQRSAIKSTFNNTLTVVTGPPGTGKSQIVLNIVANALLHGESVLFGSKLHKAVDVVIERLLRLQAEPVILKYGQKEHEVEFAESLLAAIARASSYNTQVLEREIREYKEELELVKTEEKRAKESLSRILGRRNRISRLDAILEQIKKEVFPPISKELYQYSQTKVDSKFHCLLRSLSGLVSELEKGPNFISRILAFFGITLEKRILKKSQELLCVFPIQCNTIAVNSINNCKELLTNAQLIKKWVEAQSELINVVHENESESSVEILRERITKSKDQAISISIKYVDALMKRRLKVLGSTERRDIADYISIVRRLEGDVTGGELAEKLRRERKRMFKSVVRAFPAMAVTNLAVRHALPLSAGIVDIAIIDEASQCDIASALPLLYRAKRAVIIGDNMQLKHISNLPKSDDQQIQIQHGLTATDDQRFLYSVNSLYMLAESVATTSAKYISLVEHYRSRSEIIDFSSKQFYKKYSGELVVYTDYRKLRGAGYPAIIWHEVVGNAIRPSQGSAYNLEEVKAVVALVEDIIARTAAHEDGCLVSLGVVTPFREQANKIKDLTEQRVPIATLRKLDFLVDVAHKFQGDERDIVIFSPVLSRKTPRTTAAFLSNKNIFNVSITRARSELHIIGDRSACAQSGISHLSEFVKYVESLEPENLSKCGGKFESPWEEVLFDALNREGIRTVPQYPLYQYRLDLAIVDTEIPVDIEIDGEMWHRDIDGGRLLSDLKRDQHLIMHGWQVKRFWVYQLQNNLQKCIEEIKEILKQKK
jgi:very-short-patch-repair endonuclease/RecA/RadA recombinase